MLSMCYCQDRIQSWAKGRDLSRHLLTGSCEKLSSLGMFALMSHPARW
jgi:hypothetical protein